MKTYFERAATIANSCCWRSDGWEEHVFFRLRDEMGWTRFDPFEIETWPKDGADVLIFCTDYQWPEHAEFERATKRFSLPSLDGTVPLYDVLFWRYFLAGVDTPNIDHDPGK